MMATAAAAATTTNNNNSNNKVEKSTNWGCKIWQQHRMWWRWWCFRCSPASR